MGTELAITNKKVAKPLANNLPVKSNYSNVEYLPVEEERETFVMIATGLMGIGKSYITEQMVRQYAKSHPDRSILIFDPNFEESWNNFPAIHFDILEVQRAKKLEKKEGTRIVTNSEKNLQNVPPGIYIIAPFTIYKDAMNREQMLLTMITICNNYRGGLGLFEDVNKYTISFEKSDLQSAFKAIRHKSVDYIMHFQSTNPIRPVIYEATRVLRMHYDGYDVSKIKNKLAEYYTIIRIAQIIVNNKYQAGEQIEREYPNWRQIPQLKEKVNAYKRFFLYVFTKDKYITGVDLKDFIKACNQFLIENPNEYKSQLAKISERNRLLKKDKNTQVMNQMQLEIMAKSMWVNENMRLFKQ